MRFDENAARAYLIAVFGDFGAAGQQAVVQGNAALGHGHAFSTVIHHMEGVTVFRIWEI